MFSTDDVKKGVLVEMKGKGCRQFETFLEAQNRSWLDFFTDAVSINAIMKRIDIAVDDKVGILNVEELTRKTKNKECIRSSKLYDFKESGDGQHMGKTLYLGSKNSLIYICIYEKDYEQYVQTGVTPEDSEIKNRFEIRFMDDRATNFIKEVLNSGDVEASTFDAIYQTVKFLEPDSTLPKKEWKMIPKWQLFIGIGRKKLQLTTKPEMTTLASSRRWLQKQVMAIFKMHITIDEKLGTTHIQDIYENTILSPKHEAIIRQQTTRIEELVINDK
jgi:phage replication initiation protein